MTNDVPVIVVLLDWGGAYLRGWSPTHQQPITTADPKRARRFRGLQAIQAWWNEQPGSGNLGPVRLKLEESPKGEDS